MNTQSKPIKDPLIMSHSLAAEQSIIGGLLLGGSVQEVMKAVDIKDFYVIQHRYILGVILELHEKSSPIDLVIVTDNLEENDLLEEIGGFQYLCEITKNTPSKDNLLTYSQIVREKALKRIRGKTVHDISESNDHTQVEKLMLNYLNIHNQYQDNQDCDISFILRNDEPCNLTNDWLIEGYIPQCSFGLIYGKQASF